MSYAEYVEWNAFHGIEPFGDYRGDLQAAAIAAASQAPHVKGSVDLRKFVLFPPDRFEEPDDVDEDALDRILERAARTSMRSDHASNR